MRVIAGSARGSKLISLEGLNTRPTTDRIKETLFNIINMDILDSNFLDICSGSGAIGIEALSRGAKSVTMVEPNSEALKIINKNLSHTKFLECTKVHNKDAFSFLKEIENEKFDIIFIDPPYELKLYVEIINLVLEKKLLSEDGYIIVEKSSDDDLKEYNLEKIEVYRQKKFKTTTLDFLRFI